jgi:hypothetical protein
MDRDFPAHPWGQGGHAGDSSSDRERAAKMRIVGIILRSLRVYFCGDLGGGVGGGRIALVPRNKQLAKWHSAGGDTGVTVARSTANRLGSYWDVIRPSE